MGNPKVIARNPKVGRVPPVENHCLYQMEVKKENRKRAYLRTAAAPCSYGHTFFILLYWIYRVCDEFRLRLIFESLLTTFEASAIFWGIPIYDTLSTMTCIATDLKPDVTQSYYIWPWRLLFMKKKICINLQGFNNWIWQCSFKVKDKSENMFIFNVHGTGYCAKKRKYMKTN